MADVRIVFVDGEFIEKKNVGYSFYDNIRFKIFNSKSSEFFSYPYKNIKSIKITNIAEEIEIDGNYNT